MTEDQAPAPLAGVSRHDAHRVERAAAPKRRQRGGANAQNNAPAPARRQTRRSDKSATFAAIDLGTNNCRLLVAKSLPAEASAEAKRKPKPQRRTADAKPPDSFRVTDAFSRIVRLGEGLASTGRLSDEAMERTMAALRICASKLRKAQPLRLDAVATEACRRAENGDAFLARIADELGIDLRVITGQEEALLSLKSCVPLIDTTCELAAVFDIGGGSTEVSVVKVSALNQIMRAGGRAGERGHGREPTLDTLSAMGAIDSVSAPVGVVTLAEVANNNADTPQGYAAMRRHVSGYFAAQALRQDLAEKAASGKMCVIGTGGTITTLKALNLGLTSYNRAQVDGTTLARDQWAFVIRQLARMSPEQRAANGCIGHGRADLVLPGCAILEGMLDLWPVKSVGVADRGLREGLLVTMMRSINDKTSNKRRGRGRGRATPTPRKRRAGRRRRQLSSPPTP